MASKVDKKRIELSTELCHIPTRSDVLRMALDNFLQAQTVDTPAKKAR